MDDRDFRPGDVVRHFKNETIENPDMEYIYMIIGTAHHSETGEELMIYKNVKTGEICARPLEMFLSEVDHETYPDIKQKYRFEHVSMSEAARFLRKKLEVMEETNG